MKRLPLFEKKNQKKIAENRCNRIAETLSVYYTAELNPGFMNGLAGISCFFFHYYSYSGCEKYRQLGYLALEKVIREIEKGFSNPSFSVGLCGIDWIFKYLGARGFISRGESEIFDELKPLFKSFAKDELQQGNYDYLHAGLGMWMAWDCYNRITPSCLTDSYEIANIIKKGLIGISEKTPDGSIFWESPKSGGKTKHINLGLAHGIPSVLLILSKIYKYTSDVTILDSLIRPGMEFLLNQPGQNHENISVFPVSIENMKARYPSKMAWCYGDPGVATAIFQIGENCGTPNWMDLAEEVLILASLRKETKNTMVYDSCLCHGSAGLAIIYYKAWLQTGKSEYFETSSYWAGKTLDYGNENKGYTEYTFKVNRKDYLPVNNLLEGNVGVGLSLLAMLEGELPGWEKGLLI